MKPDLLYSFASDWQGVPPGIPSGDLLIWFRYRAAAAKLFDRLYFNVRVGEPIAIDPDLPPEIIDMAIATSRRRIDVVGETSTDWGLIELKYNAGTESLGQILMYKALWLQDPPDFKAVNMVIVSDRANKDLLYCCKYYNVDLIVV